MRGPRQARQMDKQPWDVACPANSSKEVLCQSCKNLRPGLATMRLDLLYCYFAAADVARGVAQRCAAGALVHDTRSAAWAVHGQHVSTRNCSLLRLAAAFEATPRGLQILLACRVGLLAESHAKSIWQSRLPPCLSQPGLPKREVCFHLHSCAGPSSCSRGCHTPRLVSSPWHPTPTLSSCCGAPSWTLSTRLGWAGGSHG